MNALVNLGLPVLIMLGMVLVGLELTAADLRRVLHYPLHIAAALAGQVLVLPLIAAALILSLDLPPAVAGGLVLVAAAPQAASSNVFCLLARSDVALSVTLTAVSSLLAVLVTPLLAAVMFRSLLEQGAGFSVPALKVMQQVATGLLLPVAAGMLARHRFPSWAARNRGGLKAFGLTALLLMLGLLVVDQAAAIAGNFQTIVLSALLFTTAAATLGFSLAMAFGWGRQDAVTLVSAFPSRSLSLATLLAVNVLERREFLSFAVVFFLVQSAVLVPTMLFARGASRS